MDSSSQKWEPMHEHVSRVKQIGNDTWQIESVRDFIYINDAPPVYQWSEKTIDITKITRAHFYTIPLQQFGRIGRIFSHTCIGFSFKDGNDLLYSIEVRQPKGKEYRPSTGSENVRIFAMLNYFRGFRHVVRKRGFFRYPLNVSKEQATALLHACLEDSQENYGAFNHYHAIKNQCTNALFRVLNKKLNKPISWHPGWYITGLAQYALASCKLISTKDKEVL